MTEESWKPVRGFEGHYEVSSLGRIKSLERYRRGKSNCLVPVPEKVLTVNPRKSDGYCEVRLRKNWERERRSRALLVHRLVAEAFIGDCPEGWEVDHKDGVRSNNRADNLQFLTPSENVRKSRSTKLDPDRVQSIIEDRSSGMTQDSIARKHSISQAQVSRILHGHRWKEFSPMA